MKTVKRDWGLYGMKSWRVVEYQEGDAFGLHVQAIMLWENFEAFEKAIQAKIPQVMADRPNYTSITFFRNEAKVLKHGSVE